MSVPVASPPRVNVIGTGISAIDMAAALEIINAWIAAGERHFVCLRDAHGVIASRRHPGLREAHRRAGLVTPDGMPLVWLCRRAGYPQVDRVYGPDLLLALCGHSLELGYRHYFYGGGDGVAAALAARLGERFRGLAVVGAETPPFREPTVAEDVETARRIDASGADIVWVGLGTPKQELWMARQRQRLVAPVLIGIGAAFDYHSGRKRQAPYWVQRSGLEWLYRLAAEPHRLLRRYATTVPAFLWLAVLQQLGLKEFPLDRQ
jgi:N-acetylglucosaminyldiphosphoundecaprenol N-acetyl-beta-D-mannosaminyltransferase